MAEWLKKAVFYEVYPNSFMDSNGDGYGDFIGIKEKLQYIKDLGFNAIWINPCFDSPFMDGGYDIRDYFKPSERYGSMEEMDEMLDEAKKLGIKVILDLVAGHTSEENEMFIKSGLPERNEYSGRYIWTNSVWAWYNTYRLVYGRHQRNGAFMSNFFSFQPALNYGFKNITEPAWQMHYKDGECIKTREWLISVINFWLSKGYDGFRVDMADSLVKNDEDKSATIEVWQYIFAKVKTAYPESVFVSEWSDSEKAMEAGFDADFYLDQKDNGYHNLLRRYAEGKNLSFFDREGKGDISRFVYDYLRRFLPTKKGGLISFITGNHDITRISEYYTMHELKLIYATLFTFPGVPFMYYGDEIGMKQQCVIAKEGGYERCGCRTPMQWDNSKNKGFSNANELFLPVDNNENAPTVAAQLLDKDSLLNCVKDIIKLRMSDDAFTSSDFEVMYSESGKFPFVYKRGKYFIVVNPGLKNEKIPLNESINAVFSIGISAVISNEMLIVPPQSFTILK